MNSKVEENWNGFKWDGVLTDESIFEQHRKDQEIAAKEYQDSLNKREKVPIVRGQVFKHEHGGEKFVLVKPPKRNL